MKRSAKLFLFLTVLLTLGGCPARDPDVAIAKDFQKWTEYVKDHRTGLCFLRMVGALKVDTQVPCTPEVERLLINPRAPASMR